MKQLTKLLNKVSEGSSQNVIKGMSTLVFGAGFSRLISFFAIPVVTRLYSPEDFGFMSIFVSYSQILAVIMTLQYSAAIPLPKNDKESAGLLTISMVSILIITSSLFLLMSAVEIVLEDGWEYGLSLLVLLGASSIALYESLSMWSTRKRNYKLIAKTNVLQVIFGNLVKIILGVLSFNYYGLVLGQIVAQSAGITNIVKTFGADIKNNINKLQVKKILVLVKKYKDFPVYKAPSVILTVLAIQAPILFCGVIYDIATVGQLGLAITVLSIPLNILANSAGKAYLGEISAIGRKNAGEILEITLDVVKKMFLLAIVPAFVLFFYGEVLFKTIFGSGWAVAGEMSAILSVMLLANFISNPVQNAFTVLSRNKEFLKISIRRLFLVTGCFVFSYVNELGIMTCLSIYSCLMTCHFLFTTRRVLVILRDPQKRGGNVY